MSSVVVDMSNDVVGRSVSVTDNSGHCCLCRDV